MATYTQSKPQKTDKQAKNNVTTFVCPAEKHISVASHEILSLFRTSMNVAQKQMYEEVCQLIESLYSQEFMTLRRSIKHNFLPFSTGAKGQQLVTRKGRTLPPKVDLDHREVKLVEDFLQLMASARFTLMTNKEWDVATAEKFMFYLPVDVNWDYFDDSMLKRFWDSTPERKALRRQLPDLADRVLLLHRGIGLAQDSGLFINHKVDLLVEYLIVWPLMRLWSWLVAVFSRWLAPLMQRLQRRQALRAVAAANAAPSLADGHGPGVPLNPTPLTSPPAGPIPAANGAVDNRVGGRGGMWDMDDKQQVHRATRVVERRTLSRLLPTAWSVITSLPTKLDLQEPMYKEVVVLYRTSERGRSTSKKQPPVATRTNEERLKDILARRNVHIKCFHDIPLADMEVIFPDKKVFLKTLSIINLLVQAITTFVAAIASLWKMGALDMKAVTSALSMVAARCGALYSSMQAERSTMIQQMVNILYDKTNDAQEGVLSMLLEDMAEQQVKEAVLAYTMLHQRAGDELTREELDDLCERWLDANFDLQLDFAVEDALPQLVNWGLVTHNPKNNRYMAVPLDVAHACLSKQWNKAYEALSKPPVTRQLPLDALLHPSDRPGGGLDDDALCEPCTPDTESKRRHRLGLGSLFRRKGSNKDR